MVSFQGNYPQMAFFQGQFILGNYLPGLIILDEWGVGSSFAANDGLSRKQSLALKIHPGIYQKNYQIQMTWDTECYFHA